MVVLLYAGEIADDINVGAALCTLHNDKRVATIAELARRKAGGVPLDGLEDPGPYTGREDLDGVTIKARVLSAKALRVLDAKLAAAFEHYLVAAAPPMSVDANNQVAGLDHGVAISAVIDQKPRIVEAGNRIYDAKAAYVSAVVREVNLGGDPRVVLVAGEHGFPDGILEALDKSKLILPLFDVAQSVQGLSAKKA